MAEPKVSIVLDKRAYKKGPYPIKICVTFPLYIEGKTKYLQKYYRCRLKERATPAEFEHICKGQNLRIKEQRMIRANMVFDEHKAKEIIREFPHLTPSFFEEKWKGHNGKIINVPELFDILIERYEQADQIGTAKVYKRTKNALIEFAGEDCTLYSITEEVLMDWKNAWKKDQNTIMNYMSCLRHVFNYAMHKDRRYISPEFYPFGKSGMSLFYVDKPNRKALFTEEKNILLRYVPVDEIEREALSLWKWSYFGNGMNPMDIAHLTQEKIHNNTVSFYREKTKRSKNPPLISFVMNDELKSILKEYGHHEPYLFGVISDKMDKARKYTAINTWIKRINRVLKDIKENLKISSPLRFGTARPTNATMSLESGAHMREVQDNLGHTKFMTTQKYTKGMVTNQRSIELIEKLGLPKIEKPAG